MFRALVLRWCAHSIAGAYLTVILISHWFEFKKIISVEDAASASLQGEVKYPRMLMVLGLMKIRYDGAYIEQSSHWNFLVTSLSHQSAMNDNQCTFGACASWQQPFGWFEKFFLGCANRLEPNCASVLELYKSLWSFLFAVPSLFQTVFLWYWGVRLAALFSDDIRCCDEEK